MGEDNANWFPQSWCCDPTFPMTPLFSKAQKIRTIHIEILPWIYMNLPFFYTVTLLAWLVPHRFCWEKSSKIPPKMGRSLIIFNILQVCPSLWDSGVDKYNITWWLIPLSKWDITPVINGISRVNPLIIGVITHLLSEMSHQVINMIQCNLCIYEWRTKLLTTRNGHGQSGWSPIGCEGLYFHAMCKNRG